MRTLVLNKSYMPIAHISWKRALSLICKGRAEIIETFDKTINTSDDFYFMPAVIRTTYFDGVPKRKVTYSRRAILERDNFMCQYCSERLSLGTVTIDHVVPKSHGGKTTFENTVAACFACNNKKGNRLNPQVGLKLQIKPTKPKFQEYRMSLGDSIYKEWADYIPRRMLRGIQITS